MFGNKIRKIAFFLQQFIWILCFWEIGKLISICAGGYYSGSLIGMLLLFLALLSGLIKAEKIQDVSALLVRLIFVFLLPFSSYLIPEIDRLFPYIFLVVVAFVVSTAVLFASIVVVFKLIEKIGSK